jgi:hypothetical protein
MGTSSFPGQKQVRPPVSVGVPGVELVSEPLWEPIFVRGLNLVFPVGLKPFQRPEA